MIIMGRTIIITNIKSDDNDDDNDNNNNNNNKRIRYV